MTTPVPGKIIEVRREGVDNRIGIVEFDGKRRAIYLNLVPDAQLGDYVQFHAGFATERVDAPHEGFDDGPSMPSDQNNAWASAVEIGKAYRLLSELNPQQLRKLIPLAQDKQFDEDDIIFHYGDQSLFLHLIVSGEVALEEVSGAQPVQVQALHAGDAMGWSALTPGARTHFQARALSPVRTLAFPGDGIRVACDSDPALGYALLKRLVELLADRLDALRIHVATSSHA
jgi:CRP/FNR family cyclic AMP-dependent transcriptional regulator